MNEIKHIYGHTSPETAFVVEDYPWGFRLRTKIRYWIESKDAKNGGQRFVSQTVNPKTGAWCAPKYSTYSPLMVMYLDCNSHLKISALSCYSSLEEILKFKDTHLQNLTEFQKEKIKEMIAIAKVMEKVTFTVSPVESLGFVSLTSQKPEDIEKRAKMIQKQEERKKEKEENLKLINRAINYEMKKVVL